MNITVASGKGGTGKTTIATSLALSLSQAQDLLFLDCDVEAPNAHIFLEPRFERREEVSIPIPQVDQEACTHCGRCAEVCPWHAIAVVGTKTLVFPELCHGCGSCTLACPEGAISEVPDRLGLIEAGPARGDIQFGRGLLDVGKPMAVPIIHQLKKWLPAQPGQIRIIDASPGTTCPVVESMKGADFVLLVTEPTPFGLHDLRLTVKVTQVLGLPVGVIVNRATIGDDRVDDYCQEAGLPILMRIPLDQRIAEGIARGIPLIDVRPEYIDQFRQVYQRMLPGEE